MKLSGFICKLSDLIDHKLASKHQVRYVGSLLVGAQSSLSTLVRYNRIPKGSNLNMPGNTANGLGARSESKYPLHEGVRSVK